MDATKSDILSPNEHALLKNSKLINDLSDQAFEDLLLIAKRVSYKADDILLNEGMESDALFIIISGSVALYKKNFKGTSQRLITTLDKGHTIGEMRIVKNQPCSLTVKAREPTTALMIPISTLRTDKYHQTYRSLLSAIILILNERLKDENISFVQVFDQKLKKMKQLWLSITIIVVLFFLVMELAFAVYYLMYSSDFCNLDAQSSGDTRGSYQSTRDFNPN